MNPEDSHITFEEYCKQIDQQVEYLRWSYDTITSDATTLLERNRTNYEVKQQGKWVEVSHCTFNKFKGPRRINGMSYVGPIKQ